MYNLHIVQVEYSDNYFDTSGSFLQFKKDESPVKDAGNPNNISTINSSLFNYKLGTLRKRAVDGALWNTKIAVPLIFKHFLKSLETPLINCKIILNWIGLKLMEIQYSN